MLTETKHAMILEGPPLSGKTAQAKLLHQKFGYHHIDSGQLARQSGAFSQKVRAGDLLPDEFVADLMLKSLPELLPDKLVITGFPRSLWQAEWIKKTLSEERYRICAVLLNVPEDILVSRLTSREKNKRPDDRLEVFKHRLSLYRGYGYKVRSFLYLNLIDRAVHEVNGDGTQDAVTKIIAQIVIQEQREMTPRMGYVFPSPSLISSR